MDSNLTMHYKAMGRSYQYKGQDLTESPWYLIDEDGVRYEDQVEYQKVKDAKKAKVVKKKVAVKKVVKKAAVTNKED